MSKKTIVTEFMLTLPTWRNVEAEEMPMFNENRNHQGTTGNPYPNRIVSDVDRVHREDKEYICVRLENEYLRIEILPELGGRVYSAYDKRTGYDFFYKQHVIKPALIGYLGAWISGGLEFNWPCHHRPSTFMPTDYTIEEAEDGSVTVWLGENDPLYRTRGMVGISLAPDAAVFDTKMRLYNRTAVRRPFMWWENAAVPVHEQYRLFFPPDVHYVQNHYRRHNTHFPIAQGDYAGIRMKEPVDISYHKNSHSATSYFAAASHYDFFGGYDEGKNCGVVHIADSRISQGKKMFTWGYGPMEKAWENALTDEDGMYAELMAGSYTTDQPDFNWIQPYETKEFVQSWYPIGDMGIPSIASYHAAARLEGCDLTLQSTRRLSGVILQINGKDAAALDLEPGDTYRLTWEEEIVSIVLIEDGLSILSYEKKEEGDTELPPILPPMPAMDELECAEDYYLAGVHADQYRDPVILPETYFEAGVKRFPRDSRLLHALARAKYMKGYYQEAYELGLRAWKEVTRWNFRPESGDLPYTLGLITEVLGKNVEAMDWYARACWQADSVQRAFTRMALLSLRMGDPVKAADYTKKAGDENLTALAAKAVALSRIRRIAEADACLERIKALDPLFVTGRCLLGEDEGAVWLTDPAQTALDLANDLCELDEKGCARQILENLKNPTRMTAIVCEYLGGPTAENTAALPVGIAYPLRELERRALEAHLEKNPADGCAAGLLGCWYYANTHYEKADQLWYQAIQKDPSDWISCRNHAAALYTHLGRRVEALPWMKKAMALKPDNSRLLWETLYVMARLNCAPRERIEMAEAHMDICSNDVWLLYVEALNQAGEYEKALEKLLSRQFTPCEGGEGSVTSQYMFATCSIAQKAQDGGEYEKALEWYTKGMILPESLGAGLWNDIAQVPFQYGQAVCLEQLGEEQKAAELFDDILSRTHPDAAFPQLEVYKARILMRRGKPDEAEMILADYLKRAEELTKPVDAGWYANTAFYLCFIEPAKMAREAASHWLRAAACEALNRRAEALWLLESCIEKDPQNLNAHFMYAQLRG